jgi:hypothetical protein
MRQMLHSTMRSVERDTVPKESSWKALSKPTPNCTCPRCRRSASPPSGWTPLAWTPFQVRYAPDAEGAANAVALAVHRAREVLARRLRVTVPVRVLVVDGSCEGAQSLRPESTLWIPRSPARAGPSSRACWTTGCRIARAC